jgi:hypothetical protein
MGSSSGSNPVSGTPATPPADGSTPPAAPPVAGTTNPPVVPPAAGIAPPALPIALKVSFTLNTPDGLREISFGLEKDTDGVKVNWTITFVLFERADTTKNFGDPVVSLNVFVATALHPHAEKAAQGLTPQQTAHATGPAADAAKAVNDGTMPLPLGNKIIQGTLK